MVVGEATSSDATDRYVVDQETVTPDDVVSLSVVPTSPIATVPVVPSPFTATPSSDADTAYVTSLYKAVLGRAASAPEVAGWVANIKAGMSMTQVATDFVNSAEHRQDEVDAYYEDFLGRPADPTGGFFVNELISGTPESTVVEQFLESAEFQAAHTTAASFVGALYTDVLGRVADSGGSTFWVNALAAGTSRAQAVVDFVLSAEASQDQVTSFYAAYLHRQPEGTAPWLAILETPGGSAGAVAEAILASPEFVQDSKTAGG